jgi:hypothetical protein
MTKVFFGGSRSITKLNSEIKKRIDNVIASGFTVLVGDANGADKALQKYLADKKYNNVTVYCSGDSCRNNLGRWREEHVPSSRAKKDFEHYAIKDARMGQEAEYGLFLWDGKSRGTLNNVFTLTAHDKKVVLYFSPSKNFVHVRKVEDLKGLLAHCDRQVADSVERRLSEGKVHSDQSQLDLA